jgi:hypothetical protein
VEVTPDNIRPWIFWFSSRTVFCSFGGTQDKSKAFLPVEATAQTGIFLLHFFNQVKKWKKYINHYYFVVDK